MSTLSRFRIGENIIKLKQKEKQSVEQIRKAESDLKELQQQIIPRKEQLEMILNEIFVGLCEIKIKI